MIPQSLHRLAERHVYFLPVADRLEDLCVQPRDTTIPNLKSWRRSFISVVAGPVVVDVILLVNWVNSTGRRNTSMMRCCNAETETEKVRPGGSACDAFAWSAAGNGACGAATVLEGDRAGAVE